jgi:hypothetical protein
MSNVSDEQLLDEAILQALKNSGRDVSIEDLRAMLAERLSQDVDKYAVRESVWRLIAGKLAALTPRRTIRAR